jgi:hypothetical protein
MTTQREVSGWAIGWTAFAAFMMMLIGSFHAFAGLVGLLENELYVATPNYLLQLDLTTWGWIHLLMGAILLLAGVFLLQGQVWARTIGVILAVISIFANFAWLPWYPLWSIVMITVGIFVIWALTVHGRDIAEA